MQLNKIIYIKFINRTIYNIMVLLIYKTTGRITRKTVRSCRPPTESPVWRHLSRQRIARFAPAVFLAGLLLLAGCRNEASDPAAAIDLDSLPVSVPEPVLTVDAIDTMLFAFLYPYSTPLDDGSVLLADARRSQVYQLNRDGTGGGRQWTRPGRSAVRQ